MNKKWCEKKCRKLLDLVSDSSQSLKAVTDADADLKKSLSAHLISRPKCGLHRDTCRAIIDKISNVTNCTIIQL